MNTMSIIPLILFVIMMTLTPGPNNMLLTATGAQFGYKKTIPLIMGIIIGVLSLLLLSALGLGILFTRYEIIHKILKVLGISYILYLSLKILLSSSAKHTNVVEENKQAPGIVNGLFLQFFNPKAYLMTITATSVYGQIHPSYTTSILVIFLVFFIITPLSISCWAIFGSSLKTIMTDKVWNKRLKISLSVLTALSGIFIIL
ncbi:LysE family translocator [Spirochaeta cellobiosiphila]|uniref:LysE family translocator n=1 Tax=Spirochaeta cellobiosiphila TaxID=504483 RepID=UPI0004002710|nr:LysE family transporter [Spirochaeta cellobiosiphila]